MKQTKALQDCGQSLWLDNITRDLLNDGTLQRYIDEFSVTGLTSNPTIFEHAIESSTTYDADISRKASSANSAEDLFFDLALSDLGRAADLFRPIFARTDGVDGWVSLEVSPLLARDAGRTIDAARDLHRRGGRPNLFIKIPGTAEGIPAIEEAIFAGVPINVTLLFSREQYVAAAEAYLRGIERRIAAGLNPAVASVASLFISRWDVAVAKAAPRELTNRLGIAVAQSTYDAYQNFLASPRFQRAANAGARPQRLLFASTGTKDPKAPDILYAQALAAPFTINTMPEAALKAFDDHGEIHSALSPDGGDSEVVLAGFAKAGVDIGALAVRLQEEGAAAFAKSWNELMARIADKGRVEAQPGPMQASPHSTGER
ncbi:transaldolase [Mesorhizobium sp. VK22B]|uniref:Transaldolase n=1 Tax=Mesorhizobium captivum TaxID=3072319 RepID=A0ABU4Z6E7_9HYPH|nr:transaldolase [Mesorhizobium sp. VK22B]MDX8494801.1 transaldolase [Mesorhizobium sp. VK22B]